MSTSFTTIVAAIALALLGGAIGSAESAAATRHHYAERASLISGVGDAGDTWIGITAVRHAGRLGGK